MFDTWVKAADDTAMSEGLWNGKYSSVNHHEYFAEGVQSWFDDNRENDHDHNHDHTLAERAVSRTTAPPSAVQSHPSRPRASSLLPTPPPFCRRRGGGVPPCDIFTWSIHVTFLLVADNRRG